MASLPSPNFRSVGMAKVGFTAFNPIPIVIEFFHSGCCYSLGFLVID
jgi:hypothetical protein